MERARATQAEQPHWITPLATVTPLLEQEFRYDVFGQGGQAAGSSTTNWGGGKGLECIPARRVEVILGIPPYVVHHHSPARSGIGDTPFLLKYRVRSADASHGNYILTLFFKVSAATATNANGSGHGSYGPTIAFGKGWGNFDLQSTWGTAIPMGAVDRIGTPISENTALQYRLYKFLWPEVEIQSTWWTNGDRAGKKQTFLTPGLMLGKFPIHHRLGLAFGAGMEIAATHYHAYNHNVIFSVRLPF